MKQCRTEDLEQRMPTGYAETAANECTFKKNRNRSKPDQGQDEGRRQ